MSLVNFVAKVTSIPAVWLNKVDVLLDSVFASATTKAAARTALTSDAPMSVAQGGTNAITAAAALTNLGAPSSAALLAGATPLVGATGLQYAQTPAEQAASVTPQSLYIVNDYTGLIVPDRFLVGSNNPGVTDMTSVIQKAYSVLLNQGFGEVFFLGTKYLCSDTAISIVNANKQNRIRGIPLRTVLINKAGANKPTIKLAGGQYVDIEGIIFAGLATFPNYGIEMVKDGSGNTNAWVHLRKLLFQTNGAGWHLQAANNIYGDDLQYWPSGGPNVGATIDANGQPNFLIANGTDAVNSVYLDNINIGAVNTIANSGCGIFADGSASGSPFQDWDINRLEAEYGPTPTTGRALRMSNCVNGQAEHVFSENTNVLFDKGCRQMDIQIQAGASGTLTIDGSTTANVDMKVHDCIGHSFTADSANIGTIQENNSWQVAPGNNDSSTNRTRTHCRTTGGVLQPDIIGTVGVAFGQSASAQNITGGGATIDNDNALSVARVTASAAWTGIILAPGNTPGQVKIVINESVAANTLTFAAAGTSNVADGVSCVLAGLAQKTFVWDSVTALWYHS